MTSALTTDAPIEEAALVAGLQANDPRAFAHIVREFGPRMLAVTRRLLQHEQDSQDAVQDAFVSVVKAIHTFHGEAALGTWLHRIAVNAALMKLRQRKRRGERSIEDFLPTFVDDGHLTCSATAWQMPADQAASDRETRELVRRGIDELPESHRTILMLRDIFEHSTEETAAALGISEGAVKTRLHRARLALRMLLDAHFRGASA